MASGHNEWIKGDRMMNNLNDILGVPDGTTIQVTESPHEPGAEIWHRTVDSKALSMYTEDRDIVNISDTVNLFLGNLYWRIPEREVSVEVKEFFKALKAVFPTASYVVPVDSSDYGNYYRLFNDKDQLTYQLFDSPYFEELELGIKYPLRPVETPWRRLKVVEDTEG